MIKELRPALVLIVFFTIITGVIYPFVVTGVAQVVFPHQANGSLAVADGNVVGSELMGQNFSGDHYFHGRPSATVGADPADPSKTIDVPYNAANSAGSNRGPTSKALVERMQAEVEKLKSENPNSTIPIDLVTASGSGLDPHISPEAALFQVPRVATARKMPEDQVRQLVTQNTQGRTFGLLGEPRVNVLALNMALDRSAGR
jgi:K+-transporting ATPase ATPase C chain